jgi:hypothetical protein
LTGGTNLSFVTVGDERALMVRGRHDPFFELAETLSWMDDLPRMETHILDGGTSCSKAHAAAAGKLMRDFVEHTSKAASS